MKHIEEEAAIVVLPPSTLSKFQFCTLKGRAWTDLEET